MLSLISAVSLGWTTVHQTAFGASYNDIAASIRAARVNGSVLDSLEPNRALGRIWHLPTDVHDTYGLGGGIAFAWDPQLCDVLLPTFREDIFFADLITCGDVQQAMSRAFAAWSRNHRLLNFLDVTKECERMHGEVTRDCELVELWITSVTTANALTALERSQGDVTEAGVPVALATSYPRYVSNRPNCSRNDRECLMFRMTNGVQLPGPNANFGPTQNFIETYSATISFGVSSGTCWYLDSSFCSVFHKMKKWSSPSNVLAATRLVVFFVFAAASLSLLFRCHVFGAYHRYNKRKKRTTTTSSGSSGTISCSCRKRCLFVYEEAATWSVMGLTMQLVLIIVPPMVQFQIFEPCFECFDFEGAAVHEVGHVLGLGHPNTAREEVDSDFFARYGTRGDNVYNSRIADHIRYDSQTCWDTWGDVYNNTPPDADIDSSGCKRGYNDQLIGGCVGIRDSVMEAFTQNNPSVCLAQDDLEAIHTLYPDCQLSVTEPVCYRVNLNLGVVRIAVYVLFPLLIILFFVVTFQTAIQNHNREEIAEHKVMIKEHRKELVANKFKLAVAKTKTTPPPSNRRGSSWLFARKAPSTVQIATPASPTCPAESRA